MKIALPTFNNEIDGHFGHCSHFTVFSLNDKKEIIEEEKIQSPEGCGCKSNIASVLSSQGVKVMLAGNMGDGAVNVLAAQGIQVIRGCSGNVRTVAENWIKGNVSDSGEGCHSHEHGCENH